MWRTTPGRLVQAMGALVLLAVLAGGLALWAAVSISEAVRTIGKDAEPSVALALGMEATLGDMDAAALGDSLTDGGAATGTSRRFGDGVVALSGDVVEAARNVTYGEAEAGPLRELLRGLAMYERAVDEVRAVGDDPWLLSHRVQWASRVEREFAPPAALALAQANASVLEDRYSAYRATSLVLGGAAVVAMGVLIAALLGVQVWLVRRTRRVVNPGLAAATVVVAGVAVWFGVAVLTERADLRAAKVDAYDSLSVLFQAKTVANALRADMSLWLLDPAERPAAVLRMNGAARTLVAVDLGAPQAVRGLLDGLQRALTLEQQGQAGEAAAATPRAEGLLGKELANITFGVPERQAATDAMRRLVDALGVVGAVQALEQRRLHSEAVWKWLDGRAGGAAAFLAIEEALDRTIAVNQREFDRRVTSASGTASTMPWVTSLGMVLVALLSVGGLWLRLHEYR